jgi:hypothetical protein
MKQMDRLQEYNNSLREHNGMSTTQYAFTAHVFNTLEDVDAYRKLWDGQLPRKFIILESQDEAYKRRSMEEMARLKARLDEEELMTDGVYQHVMSRLYGAKEDTIEELE